MVVNYRKIAAAIGAVVMALCFSSASTWADGYGPDLEDNGPISLPDDTGASYCFGGSFTGSTLRDKAHDAELYLDSRTVTYRIFGGCNPNDTDMRFESVNLPGDAIGMWACELGAYGVVCVAGAVLIDANAILQVGADCASTYGMDAGTAINAELVHTIRHEVGHANGLHHGDSPSVYCERGPANAPGVDSMVSGAAFNSLAYFSYHDHHACHINAWLVYGFWDGTCGD